ncbi:hypothetical protein M2650_13525 [Luteimonas sp. SX5]|uniref:Lipoprotein n=1 Tax=Luteimonas galliterrae TaxID=2940486 RepID=A0ABT0ML82_9GAMM|nr:hypothetical protein [Luteimonas galliterrae]MCL1635643.1 hypothetical protein [Luteimonas galliterrae]
MQRLQHVFQRGALALALLTAGIGCGYGLYRPDAASPCASAAGIRTYSPERAAVTADHAACNCANA